MDRMQTLQDRRGPSDALTVGTIDGGGTGRELIDCVKQTLECMTDLAGQRFELLEFDDARWAAQLDEERYDADLHRELSDFYERVRERRGVIVRGSLPAPVLYRLRQDLGQALKWVPLNPFPTLSGLPELRVTLVRESVHGAYHAEEIRRHGDVVQARFAWHQQTLRFVAREAFALARRAPPHRVTTILKTSVLGEIGELWLEAFREEGRRHPDVQLSHRPSGAGFSDLWLAPREFGVIATDDQSGDILADLLPTVLYGTRNPVAAGNLSPSGHASFQTDHGTIKPLVGKDAVNPVAMLGALSMALEHALPGSGLGLALDGAVEDVLRSGLRTQDFYSGPPQRLVGTREMTERILERLALRLVAPLLEASA